MNAFAQLFGKVTDEHNKALSYATISIKNNQHGTICNQEGNYEITLAKGNYEVVFQYLGYGTKIINVIILEAQKELNIKLEPIVLKLNEVTINKSNEDPAATIMRKTITMSIIHHKELASYSFKAYARGNLKVLDVPFLLEKQLKKEFIGVGQLYVFESINQVSFNQPNSLKERIIALKSNLPENLKNSVNISFSDFQMYNPENTNSPVTMQGSRNYKYEYLGYFEENGLIINKIKVSPRVKNSEYYTGTLNIIDDTWYIHSFNFSSSSLGAAAAIKSIYKATEGIWIPNYTELKATVGILGIKVAVSAVAKIGDLDIIKNPKYANMKPKLVDIKTSKSEAQELNKKNQLLKTEQILDLTEKNEKLSLSSLRKLNKELNKSEIRQLKNLGLENISSDKTSEKDTLAYSRSDSFWLAERQVPYTAIESRGFKQADSLNLLNRPKILEKMKKDSLATKKANKFSLINFVRGRTFNYNYYNINPSNKLPRHQFLLGSILENTRYNAVEGLNIGINKLAFKTNYCEYHSNTTTLKPQYSIARNRLNGYLSQEIEKNTVKILAEIGRQVFQINNSNPISTIVNEYSAIFQNKHLAKYYESKYIKLSLEKTLNTNITLNTYLLSQQRSFVPNVINQSFVKNEGFYEPNVVSHLNGTNNFVSPSWLNTWALGLDYYPNLKISYSNNQRSVDYGDTKISIKNTINRSTVFFGQLELTLETVFKLPLAIVNFSSNLGGFYFNSPTNIIDYKHFDANLNLLSTHRGFRQLAYYKYSSDKSYIQYFLSIQPKRLLLTFVPITQKIGLTEYIFNNTLINSYTKHLEIGYGISLLDNKISLEYLQTFNDGLRQFRGFRIIAPLRPIISKFKP